MQSMNMKLPFSPQSSYPMSNQHIAPELSPERTFPRLYASLSASSAPVALNVFIMNSRFPPPA